MRTNDDETNAAPTRLPRWLAIALVSLAGLLLEVGYTRIVSYKLWYYYTYLVIGLALLGIGSGGIVVVLWSRVRNASTDAIVAACSIWGAISIAAGYFVIARLPINTVKIWDYGAAASYGNFALLTLICFTLFATFVGLGIILATLLGRAGEGIGRLYFADLVGAGAACVIAIPLISRLGPPAVVVLSALIFAVVGVLSLPWKLSPLTGVGTLAVAGLAVLTVANDSLLPDVRPEAGKLSGQGADFSEWGPVFRVDVLEGLVPGGSLLLHDGTFGSGIWEFDGDPASQTRFDTDSRAIPFRVLGGPPGKELIIGSAGGNEILASLHFGATDIEAVELNPVTVSLLTDHYADYTGHLADRPEVDLTQGDARSYLARNDTRYDLIWYVAPDSYAANNAASSGAFVLSESYLYTTEMIEETLDHLSDDGLMVIQFGEVDFANSPNRTARYVVTARQALENAGIDDPTQHIAVSLQSGSVISPLTTVVVKKTPFTPAEVAGFADGIDQLGSEPIYVPTRDLSDHLVAQLAGGTDAEVDALVEGRKRDISAITDDAPFFWHFAGFRDVLADAFDPIRAVDPEDAIGERVLLLLLIIATIFAAVFLLLPFVTVRRTWSAFPAKRVSTVYFAALGLGFMFFEITMIQRLVLFLGYPTYSLTVTLASILLSTGAGAYLSGRFADRPKTVMPALIGTLAVLTIFYQFGLGELTETLLTSGLAVRVAVTVVVLAPLGVCLGMFMPLGLGAVAKLTDKPQQYVAWAWAVNGFASVAGSVLTTILSMTFGFRTVQFIALGVYCVAVAAFLALQRETSNASNDADLEPSALATARPT